MGVAPRCCSGFSANHVVRASAQRSFVGRWGRMSIRTTTIALALTLVCTACVARPVSASGIVLNVEATELSGWFSAKGEWALFPSRSKRHYNPYTNDENAKCVSLINKTGSPRFNFEGLRNKHVTVMGFAVDYDKLADGDSPGDKLLSKKYFDTEPVENYCLRKYVFVVTGISVTGDYGDGALD